MPFSCNLQHGLPSSVVMIMSQSLKKLSKALSWSKILLISLVLNYKFSWIFFTYLSCGWLYIVNEGVNNKGDPKVHSTTVAVNREFQKQFYSVWVSVIPPTLCSALTTLWVWIWQLSQEIALIPAKYQHHFLHPWPYISWDFTKQHHRALCCKYSIFQEPGACHLGEKLFSDSLLSTGGLISKCQLLS